MMSDDELIKRAKAGALAEFDIDPIKPKNLGRTYKSKPKEKRLQQVARERVLRQRILNNKIPFITYDFLPGFFLGQGLVLVGAEPGSSKSTTASNVLSGFLREVPDRQAVMITNEDSSEAAYNRTACVMLGINPKDKHHNRLNSKADALVDAKVMEIADKVEIISTDEQFDMTCLEDVMGVMDHAANSGAGIVILDYLQTVNWSRIEESWEPFQISKKLGNYLKEYGRTREVPVVVFAQLKPKSESQDIQSRFQNDRTIYNHAFQVIEIEPDFESYVTKFVVHKDRFGYAQGKEVEMVFRDGAYIMAGGL